jgi:hypothetical protein
MKTAIQMLIESVEYWNIKIDCQDLFKAICDQALELEKQQIINAANSQFTHIPNSLYPTLGEQYYELTFKNK